MERPSEGASVLSWDDPSGTGVLTLDAGGTATCARNGINALNPADARDWPSLAAASFVPGQRVLCKTDGLGGTLITVPDPNAVDLDGTGELA